MPQDILTVPQETQHYKTVLSHGNEAISFPQINPKDGYICLYFIRKTTRIG